jgi:hypothetical protein
MVSSSTETRGEVVDVIAVEAEINAERPGDVAKLLRAHRRARAYATPGGHLKVPHAWTGQPPHLRVAGTMFGTVLR